MSVVKISRSSLIFAGTVLVLICMTGLSFFVPFFGNNVTKNSSANAVRSEFAAKLGLSHCRYIHNWPVFSFTDLKCDALLSQKLDNEDLIIWPPPEVVPPNLADNFTLRSHVPVERYYLQQRYNSRNEIMTWNKSYIDSFISQARRKEGFNYGDSQKAFYHAFENFLPTGHGVVFGSEFPWAEAVSLAYGASKMTTIEYKKIVSEDDRILTLQPQRLSDAPVSYDFGISFSSWEHSGLGRYGDSVNPWGDIHAIRTASCLIKTSGLLFLGVPTGHDLLVWNAHRVYGILRYPLLAAGWLPVAVFVPHGSVPLNLFVDGWLKSNSTHQPLLVLKNMRGMSCTDIS